MLKRILLCLAAMLPLAAPAASAGGAWVPEKTDGDFQFGYSWKTADTSWNRWGETTHHTSWHIFRHAYAGGEVGLGKNFSFTFLQTYLDGLEGERGDMERNRGLAETYLGVKYGIPKQGMPMAVALRVRTSFFYDLPGPYDRHRFLEDEDDLDGDGVDDDAIFAGESPEWRGQLGEDYGLYYLASRSVLGRGWLNAEIGYNYRTGNFADEIPMYAELGYPLPWKDLILKTAVTYVQSVGNVSPVREDDDRFSCSSTSTSCFPDASRVVVGLGVFFNVGKEKKWWVEAGHNWFLWGRSTRKYDEPYFSIGRRFGDGGGRRVTGRPPLGGSAGS